MLLLKKWYSQLSLFYTIAIQMTSHGEWRSFIKLSMIYLFPSERTYVSCGYEGTKPLHSLRTWSQGWIISLLQILVPRGTWIPFMSHVCHISSNQIVSRDPPTLFLTIYIYLLFRNYYMVWKQTVYYWKSKSSLYSILLIIFNIVLK